MPTNCSNDVTVFGVGKLELLLLLMEEEGFRPLTLDDLGSQFPVHQRDTFPLLPPSHFLPIDQKAV